MEPFGANAPDEDPDGNSVIFHMPLRFPGQYLDKETNLAYNYFRDYDPGIGRYIQSDPIGLAAGLNTYNYVGGNPLSLIDAFGLQALPVPAVPAIPGVGKGATTEQNKAIARGLQKLLDSLRGEKSEGEIRLLLRLRILFSFRSLSPIFHLINARQIAADNRSFCSLREEPSLQMGQGSRR